MLAATLKMIRLECYLSRLSGANKVSLFRAESLARYSKTCLKRNAIVAVFFSVFTGFRFTKGCVLIK